MIDSCPHCHASFIGEPIPDEWRVAYGDAIHFSRRIDIVDRDLDRVVAFQCPDCGKRWER